MTKEEAVKKLKGFDLIGSNEDIEFQYALDMAISALNENRLKGRWITDETSGSALNDRYYCSNCGKELRMPYAVIKAEQKNGKYLFCDRCGTDMRG